MKIKIKSQINFKGIDIIKHIAPEAHNEMNEFIVDMIKDFISKGISPVKQRTAVIKNTDGGNRYKGYSESYSDAIKRGRIAGKKLRPVNLKVTGKMLNSLKSRVTPSGVKVYFDSKIAKYHDREGAGKAKIIRRLLPTNKGEEFATLIDKKIKETIEKAIEKAIR